MPRARRSARVPLVGVLAAVVTGTLAGCLPPGVGEPAPRQPSPPPVTVPATPSILAPTPSAAPTTIGRPTPGAAPTTPLPSPRPSATVAAPRAGTALAAVDALPVKGRAPRTGYDRDEFGPRWADVDRNGCDTRNDVLRRDLVARTTKPGTHGCVVLTGTLLDPYTGERIAFVRGQGTSQAVQIDHVVALADAWQKGAQGWDDRTRERFANDPLNLLAVDGPTNASKGMGDAATWLPPARASRCAYVARQVAVKRSYGLWVTRAERDAMRRVLAACPAEPLPGGAG